MNKAADFFPPFKEAAFSASHFNSSADNSTFNAGSDVRVSEITRGPISGNVGNGWQSTYASAMLIGSTLRFFASSITRSRRFQLSSEYHELTSSLSDVSLGFARSVKNPRSS